MSWSDITSSKSAVQNTEPRVALVTGASRGIGAATARRLAADGLALAINSYPDDRMIEAATSVAAAIQGEGGTAAVFEGDVSIPAHVDAMFAHIEEQLGHVDALVLNAATMARLSWTEITESEWDRMVAVNLRGAFLCARRLISPRDVPPPASVVTISSVLAKVGAPDSLHYATTKAGVVGFTRSLARELGPLGVRVNCVMPGAIQTESELETFPDQAEVDKTVLDLQILQRRGTAEDVAEVVSFLVGPGSSFMTGQTICVDGGWVML